MLHYIVVCSSRTHTQLIGPSLFLLPLHINFTFWSIASKRGMFSGCALMVWEKKMYVLSSSKCSMGTCFTPEIMWCHVMSRGIMWDMSCDVMWGNTRSESFKVHKERLADNATALLTHNAICLWEIISEYSTCCLILWHGVGSACRRLDQHLGKVEIMWYHRVGPPPSCPVVSWSDYMHLPVRNCLVN